jgi:DNA topoisomerase I
VNIQRGGEEVSEAGLASETDPEAAAEAATAAGLRYVTDAAPGITRRRAGRAFSYRDPRGSLIEDRRQLARLRSLAIPPAWTGVWICPFANGHLQATGRDARGRKQYLYHVEWRSIRDAHKFDRVLVFARALPQIRARIDADLRRRGLQRER